MQVHGDVFRPPQHASLLATYVGVGVQILGMLLITMIFALLGFLSPANRGGLMTAMVMMFVFMGLLAGYSAARLYKAFRGDEWKKMTTRTAFMFPGGCSFVHSHAVVSMNVCNATNSAVHAMFPRCIMLVDCLFISKCRLDGVVLHGRSWLCK